MTDNLDLFLSEPLLGILGENEFHVSSARFDNFYLRTWFCLIEVAL